MAFAPGSIPCRVTNLLTYFPSDIYKPTERATAISWYLSCTVIGPSFGPFMSGLIVQFASWRIIYWVQLGCAIATMLAGFFFIP